jgi:cell division protease FtsH
MARSMVTQYGMSAALGARVYGERQEMVFLGREISEQRDYSDAIAEQIDQEVRQIIDAQYERVEAILVEHRDKLELVAQRLLEVETLEAEEFVALMEGQEPQPTEGTPEPPPAPETRASEPEQNEKKEWKPGNLDLPPAPSPA